VGFCPDLDIDPPTPNDGPASASWALGSDIAFDAFWVSIPAPLAMNPDMEAMVSLFLVLFHPSVDPLTPDQNPSAKPEVR